MKCGIGEVHIWRIELNCPPPMLQELGGVLSADEKERATHFRSAELSRRWIVGRAAVRSILATYTGSEPQSLVFRIEPHGKPALAWPSQALSFNLCRTRDLALMAVAKADRVGIDAESIHTEVNIEAISRQFFEASEVNEVLGLPNDARLAAFFACWTRKEAFVKAIGTGLSLPLNTFRVSVRADEPPRLISVDWDDPQRWSLIDLSQPGLAAALAVEGPPPDLSRFNFSVSSVNVTA